MAASDETSQTKFRHRLLLNRNPEKDVNILLLGETGVGKTTFINAIANYLSYDTLDEALEGKMKILIPSSFSVSDSETHRLTTITVGSPDNNEACEDNGQSQTQGCKSYLFPIGERYLRLIDTPGIGDCRGVEQDNKNFENILSFVSRYEHLNGICIMLKPNEHRLNVFFKYGIKELLRHLHVNAKDNVVFVFTNARASSYMPGATSRQLRILLDDLENINHIQVPFQKANTFLFDNESFRFLAVHKTGHDFFREHKRSFGDSWDKSVAELSRMIARIVQCDLHAVRDMESLNEAQQLIRKLMRPIAEVARLLEENVDLAEKHKKKVLVNDRDTIHNRVPQKLIKVVSLNYPRTICKSKKCSTVIQVDGERKIDYSVRCHEHCYLRGVEQEVINNPILKHCRAIEKTTGICKRCSCQWNEHMHVTYELKKSLTYVDVDNNQESSYPLNNIGSRIDRRIELLKQEQEIIRHVCAKLRLFLTVSSINPTNDDVIEYINHFIREEKDKKEAGDDNQKVIDGLENLIQEYQEEIKLLKSNVHDNSDRSEIPTIEEIFVFKLQLFELPITGKYIKDQIENLNFNQMNIAEQREEYIDIPISADFTDTMQQLKQILT